MLDINLESFKLDVNKVDWSNVLNSNNAQESFTLFNDAITNLVDTHFPVVYVKKQLHIDKPWLTDAILKSISTKNKMYKSLVIAPSPLREAQYKNYKNKLVNIIRISQKQYYNDLLDKYHSNITMSWKIINNILNRQTKGSTNINAKFYKNGNQIVDESDIANEFNKYFVNVGNNLASKITNTTQSPFMYMNNPVDKTFFVNPATTENLHKAVNQIKSNTPGCDNITSNMLKAILPCISTPLLHVINLSFSTGIVPLEIKVGKIVPIYKGGDSSKYCNYRPISLLTVFSKVFERLMYYQLISFIETNNILYDYQCGFRKKYSTDIALISIVDKILNAFENGQYAVGIFIDLAKAFDTVNHKILLEKLNYYGIRGVANEWLCSYLSERKQCTQFNDSISNFENISCGVPQGSILGPLLFILYLNDLQNVSDVLFFLMYADDTNMFISGDDLAVLNETINTELPKIHTWFNANKLSLNVQKTNYMLFHSNRRKVNSNSLSISINDCIVNEVYQTKFLGIIFDCCLTWKPHVDYLCKKLSKNFFLLSNARKIVDNDLMVKLYNTFIYSYIQYGIVVWGNAKANAIDRLISFQKRTLKMIAGKNRSAESAPLFKKFSILPIVDIYKYRLAYYMYRINIQDIPNIKSLTFQRHHHIHNYNTRHHNDFVFTGKVTKNFIKSTFEYSGIQIWLTIPNSLRNVRTIHQFKKEYKKLILSNV